MMLMLLAHVPGFELEKCSRDEKEGPYLSYVTSWPKLRMEISLCFRLNGASSGIAHNQHPGNCVWVLIDSVLLMWIKMQGYLISREQNSIKLWVPTAWSELLETFPLMCNWTALGCEVKENSNQASVCCRLRKFTMIIPTCY